MASDSMYQFSPSFSPSQFSFLGMIYRVLLIYLFTEEQMVLERPSGAGLSINKVSMDIHTPVSLSL